MVDYLLKILKDAGDQFDLTRLIQIGVTVVAAIVAFVAVVIIARQLRKKLDFLSDLRKRHIYNTVVSVIKITIVVVAVIVILQLFGINMSVFVVIFGLLGVVITFAVKDSFQDVFTGFILMADHYFTVGDAVQFEGRDGIVVFFSVRTTKIEYLDDRSIESIANRNISKIVKLTHLVDIDLPLSYDLDRKTAFEALSEICEDIETIEGVEKCEFKGTQEFSDSAIIYKIRFFCEPNDRPDIKREVHKRIQDGLSEKGIRIPYKQLDVHSK